MREIAGQSVLVTGASSGIGRATVEHLAAAGARVTAVGRRTDRIEELAARLGELVCPAPGDINVAADRERMVAQAVQHGDGLHGLVSNAGNMYRGPITELTEDQLIDVFRTNVISGMLLSGLAVPHLERAKGCILFMGSVHTQRAFPGASPYAATKGALETLTGVLASELGPKGIRVSCIRPGAVPSEINIRAGFAKDEADNLERLQSLSSAHALNRIGSPEHIAEAVQHLLCAEWTTGSVMTVDGGLGLGVTSA